jgi:hypothetical protein|tara:strand:- start:1053 stop:1319 length:267 start_codon:yes stop_codon:yes gene_type:complete
MRGFHKEAILGKCSFCRIGIEEDSPKFSSAHAKITYGKWMCGKCLLSMKEMIDDVHQAYTRDYLKRAEEEANEIGFKINPKTGKMERI